MGDLVEINATLSQMDLEVGNTGTLSNQSKETKIMNSGIMIDSQIKNVTINNYYNQSAQSAQSAQKIYENKSIETQICDGKKFK